MTQSVLDPTAILYGRTPVRARTRATEQLREIKTLDSGVEEYYDERGDLYQLVIPPGPPHSLYDSGVLTTGASCLYSDTNIHIVNRLIHRDDAPAVEFGDGEQHWYFNGYLHRRNGPAIVCSIFKQYWSYGELHRTEGPAVEWTDGRKEWCLFGQRFDESDWVLAKIDYGL